MGVFEFNVESRKGELVFVNEQTGRKTNIKDNIYLLFEIHYSQADKFKQALETCGIQVSQLPRKKLHFSLRINPTELQDFIHVEKYIIKAVISPPFKYEDLEPLVIRTTATKTLGAFLLDRQYQNVMKYFDGIFSEQMAFEPSAFVYGRAGSGKTEFAKLYFNSLLERGQEADFLQVYPPDTIGSHWFWKDSLSAPDGATVSDFSLTPLANSLLEETNVPLVLCLDEVNRMGAGEGTIRPLLPLIASREFEIAGETVQARRPVVAYATGNVGFGYSGVETLGNAFQTRNLSFRKSAYSQEEMETIARINTGIEDDIVISKMGEIYGALLKSEREAKFNVPETNPRSMLLALNAYSVGIDWVDAFEMALDYVDESGENDDKYQTVVTNLARNNRP